MAIDKQILAYIQQNGKAKPAELSDSLDVSTSAITKNLSLLIKQGRLIKEGQGRGTIYRLSSNPELNAVESSQVQESALPKVSPSSKTDTPSMDKTEEVFKEAANRNLDGGLYYSMQYWVRFFQFLNTIFKLGRQWLDHTKGWLHRALIAAIVLVVFFLVFSFLRNVYYRFVPVRNDSAELQVALNIAQANFKSSEASLDRIGQQLRETQDALHQKDQQLRQSELESSRAQMEDQHQMALLEQDKDRLNNQLQREQAKTKQLEMQKEQSNNEWAIRRNDLNRQISELSKNVSQKDRELADTKYELSKSKGQIQMLEGKLQQIKVPTPISPVPSRVTMDQIVDLTNQQVAAQEIITRIKASHSTYSLNAQDIDWLKEHHVAPEVIAAMQANR